MDTNDPTVLDKVRILQQKLGVWQERMLKANEAHVEVLEAFIWLTGTLAGHAPELTTAMLEESKRFSRTEVDGKKH